MENFKSFIAENKNTHMTHLEDKVIYGGVNGTRQAIMALRELRNMLKGEHDGKISVKWDGAPAVFAGIDPADGKFFVAKKGIFNKNPKVYKTPGEVDADTSGDLAIKLKQALQYLPELGITEVIQGDFLYGPGDLSNETIAGEKYITFHPNTIVYAVPANTVSSKEILASKIGIVWHTTYKGNTFETMKASYGVNVSRLKKSKNVWSQDAMLRDMTNLTMNKSDSDIVNDYLTQAGKLFNKISGGVLRTLEANTDLTQLIEQHSNSYVRAGQMPPDPAKRVTALIKFIEAKFQKEMDKLKTEKGKGRKQDKLDDILSFFSANNKNNLITMFELQKVIVLAKLKLINILDRINKVKTFVKTKNGFKTTGQEGYVAIDRLGSDAVKIVDRLEFSYNNFSPDIIKGWDKPGRS